MDEAFIVKMCLYRNGFIWMSPLLGRELQFRNRIVFLFTRVVPSFPLLSFTRAISGEELVLFDGRGTKPITRRNCRDKTLLHTQHCLELLFCFAAIVCL